MSTIRTLADLHESSPYAWPGGYPVAFYSERGDTLCYVCLEKELANAEDASDDDFTYDVDTYHAEIEDGDQSAYGGVMCDACQKYIVEPTCPECGDDLIDGTSLLYADNVDASLMHRRCAAQLVTECKAKRVPGVGVQIVATKEPEYGWDDGTPWYARVGTVYSYPRS